MSILSMFASTVANDGGMRAWLVILLVLAVVLILAGCIIALFTWYYTRRVQTTSIDDKA